jgi:putative transposase
VTTNFYQFQDCPFNLCATIRTLSEHWTRIRTNNVLERIMREIRRRTRVVGNFPDGKSAVMLVAARLRHIAGTRWGRRIYLDMERMREIEQTAGEVTVA